MSAGQRFKKIIIKGWRQFQDVDIDFHPRLTIITGANGAGKSTLISVLSSRVGYTKKILSTPDLVDGEVCYLSGVLDGDYIRAPMEYDDANVGMLYYSNDEHHFLGVSKRAGLKYDLEFENRRGVTARVYGLYIDSHHPVSRHMELRSIPAIEITPKQALEWYEVERRNIYEGVVSDFTPLYRMKEAIISMAVFGASSERMPGNARLYDVLNGFERALKKILPPALGFIRLSVRPPDVVMLTSSGEFLLESSSGGIASLIDLCWRINLVSIEHDNFVVIIDEPENHLHPAMQRSLLGSILDLFPGVQLIVATHSPLVISSVEDSSVYVLRYSCLDCSEGQDKSGAELTRGVASEKLSLLDKSSTANKILREALGVEVTIPDWSVEKIHSLVEKYSGKPLSLKVLEALRSDLERLGYQDQYDVALKKLAGIHD